MKQTAVEWLYKNLLENPISNEDVEYNEAVFHNAKEMEREELRRDKEELVKMLSKLEPNMRLNSQQEIDDWK